MSRTLSIADRDRVTAPTRSTALWALAWVAGVVLWLGLAFAVGADPGYRPGASGPSAADRYEPPSAIVRRLKPSVPQPPRAWMGPVAVPVSARIKASDLVEVYRFFNRNTGVHFYTADPGERAHILATWPQFVDEGPVYRALVTAGTGTVPVWRFFNRDTGAHFYTTDPGERARILATWPQFVDEGAVFHAYTGDAHDRAPVHRFYNTATRTHFYTASDAERDHVQRNLPMFVYEGVVYYGQTLGGSSGSAVRIAAFRLVDQATFGPTPAEVDRALSMGAAAWIEDQFTRPASGYTKGEFNYESLDESQGCSFSAARDTPAYRCAEDQLTLFRLQYRFFQNAIGKPDQLRQRVAWALSQIFVVSGMKDPDMETAYVQARWHQMLSDNAFGGFEQLLYDLTISPAMGHYLDMIDNAKADPVEGTEPNENFARELLQLFSIGVVELKRDGTPLFDSQSQPIASYDQATVKAFARALTGWTYAAYPGTPPKEYSNNHRYYGAAMVTRAGAHDTGAKKLLRGIELPAGMTADADLRAALRNVFLHPNVGPFIGRQLIRHLVTGTPTPGYVERVATVFDDNGAGVRGDLKAVVRAILLDPEARNDPGPDVRYGRFREPAQYVTAILRGVGAASDGIGLEEVTRAMGQRIFYSPTVFNYYPAEYRIPGTDVVAPAMGIHNANTVLARSNFVYWMLWEDGLWPDDEVPGAIGTRVLLQPWVVLAADPRKLLAAIDDRFFGGAMPPGVRAEIYATMQAIDDAEERARTALFLAVTSFQYQVSR